MINNVDGLPPLEGPIAGVTIPFVGVDGAEADAYAAAIGETITIAPGPDIVNPDYGRAAALSSNGPRRLDSAQKPDLAAPGVSIPSVADGHRDRASRGGPARRWPARRSRASRPWCGRRIRRGRRTRSRRC